MASNGTVIEQIGKQSIIECDGKYFLHCEGVGVWAFYLKTLAAARQLAKNYQSGELSVASPSTTK